MMISLIDSLTTAAIDFYYLNCPKKKTCCCFSLSNHFPSINYMMIVEKKIRTDDGQLLSPKYCYTLSLLFSPPENLNWFNFLNLHWLVGVHRSMAHGSERRLLLEVCRCWGCGCRYKSNVGRVEPFVRWMEWTWCCYGLSTICAASGRMCGRGFCHDGSQTTMPLPPQPNHGPGKD